VTGRKVDPEMARIGVLATGELVVTGRDKILRKYKQPEELLSKMDFKVKAANTPPIEELDGHDLTTNCISFSVKNGELVTGGRDGTIIVRSGEMLSQVKNKIQSHNLASNGVSVVLASNIGRRVYSAGFDGSLFIWALEKMNLTAGYVKK
jgi:WD40 repeat protein